MATLAASGSLTAAWNGTGVAPAGSVVQLTTADATSVGVEITGTFVLTLVLEATMDGRTWFPVNPFNIVGVGVSATITAPGRCTASVADFVQVRARCSAFTSGAAVVTMDGSAAAGGGSGGGSGGGGGAVTSVDGGLTTLGTTTDAGITTNIAGTVIGFLRGSIIQWAAFLARFPAALGGTTAANSLPVTLSSDGPFVTQTGSITETAPATDIASSGLNGRLQRVAQRLSSLIALLPTALVSNRLDVNLGAAPATVTTNSTLQAGSATAGNIGGIEAFPAATFTRPADTTAYAANDAICNSTTVPAAMTFASAALRSGGGGVVMGATILDEANQTTKLNATLHLFSAVPGTLTNDNAQMAFANADLANWQGALRFTTTAVTNTASGASGSVMLFAPVGGSFPYKCAATSLFGVLQADNAYTPVSAEVLLVTLQLSQDA